VISPADPYRDWDVAYVLGSLSEQEREEYEEHLGTCDSCKAEVASLAAMPAIMSALPRDQAFELLEEDGQVDLVPRLSAAARKAKRWSRTRIAAGLVAAAAVGALVAVLLRPAAPETTPSQAFQTMLTQTIPSPVTASVTLVEEPWGTRIDIKCDYATPPDGQGRSLVYGLFVSDDNGNAVRIGTWSAGPGTSMTPSATTDLPRANITRIEIRLVSSDRTLLEARF
jgi:Putative zinc-finger